ncbi:MAG: transporter substrate-binding domain-containing protein [Alphaproteobacteria bacterium]|nr:transporter substrate-binding domain-containing protein [Alphaproteobacteria bacterium]
MAKLASGLTVLLFVSLLLGAYAPASSAESVLQTVRGRGYVKCAIGNRPVGDTRIGKTGYEGFFPEFCRILALALFGDRDAVNMSPVIIRHGLQSIAEGEVDVYISNVTWTFSRDLKLKLTPAAVLYYDGQGFMSHKGTVSGSLAKLGKATVCVARSTTTIANLKDYTKLHNLTWTVHAYESSQGRNDAFFSRKCDLMTTDRLVLATLRATATDDPANYVLHEEVISKEPLVAYVNTKDMQWANVVRWAIYATILAEEKGITRDNYKTHLASRDPVARRLLGVEATAGTKAAGLPADWARRIIAGSGNYGEIFERYLGAKSQIKITRGANKLWKNGGLMYSPPFR